MQITGSSFQAIAGGVRHQFMAPVMRQAFVSAGMLDPNLRMGFDALERTARSVTEAGIEASKQDLIGHYLDVLA